MKKIYKFKDLGKVVTGKTPSTSKVELYGNRYPFITPSDIPTYDERYLEKTERGLSNLGYNKMKSILLPPNSIGMVCIGSTIGKICLTKQECITNQQLNSIIVNQDKFNPFYLYYAIKNYVPKIKQISGGTGAGKPILNKTAFESLEIELYEEIQVQNKIAKILSNYDDLIENNNRRIKILEEMAQKIYKEWFVDFKFPGHENATFNNIELGKKVMPLKGKNITKATVKKGNIPVVAGGIEPAYYHNVANTFAPVITISASGANAGFTKLYYKDVWASDCSYIDSTMTKYVYYYYLLLLDNKTKINNMQRGAAQPHVYPVDLAKLLIKELDEDIINNFENKVSPLFEQIKILTLKNENLKQTRDILLPRLISGEINVENLEIE